jgi:hypothetical protein
MPFFGLPVDTMSIAQIFQQEWIWNQKPVAEFTNSTVTESMNEVDRNVNIKLKRAHGNNIN